MKKLDIAITTAVTILFIPLSIWGGMERWAGDTDTLPFIMMAIAFVYVVFEGVRLKNGLIVGSLSALIGVTMFLPSFFSIPRKLTQPLPWSWYIQGLVQELPILRA